MKINRKWAVVSAVLLLFCAVTWFFSAKAASVSDILQPSAVRTGMQNFSLGYDGKKDILLVGSYQNILLAYDKDRKELWRFESRGPFREVKVDSDARRIYAGCEDNFVYILDLDSGALQSSIDVERRIYSLDTTKDGSLIAVSAGVSANKHNLLLYSDAGERLFNEQLNITSLQTAFSSDEQSIFVGTNRGQILQYDLQGKQKNCYQLNYEVIGFKLLPEIGQIVVGTRDSSYTVLDENLKLIRKGSVTGDGLCIGATSDGRFIALGSKAGFLTLLDESGRKLVSKKLDYSVTDVLFTGKTAYVTGLGDFIYEMDEGAFDSMVIYNSTRDILKVLSYLLPTLLLVALILTFGRLKRGTVYFFKTLHKYRTAYLMLVPTVALLLVFCYYPAGVALVRAFTNWSRSQAYASDIRFIGFDNFRTMIEEGYFFIGLKNLGILILTSFAKVLTIPLLVAKLVFAMRSNRAKYWFRFLFIVPLVVPGVVSTLMWANIYDPTIGLVNQVLQALNLEELQRVWLGDESTAIWAVVFMGFPFIDAFAFLVYYGGLINIPSSLLEAARVDGSSPFRDFFKIQLPLITSQIKLLVVLTFIGSIQNFTSILLLTAGGPGSATYVPGLELYYNATKFGRYGYACALGVVMFLAILVGTIVNMRMKANEVLE